MPQPHTTTYLASDRANVVRLVHQLQRACALLLVSWQQRHLVCDRRVAHATDSTRHGKMSGVRGVVHKLDQVTAPRTTRKATYRRVVPLQVHENSKALGNGDTAVERSWCGWRCIRAPVSATVAHTGGSMGAGAGCDCEHPTYSCTNTGTRPRGLILRYHGCFVSRLHRHAQCQRPQGRGRAQGGRRDACGSDSIRQMVRTSQTIAGVS